MPKIILSYRRSDSDAIAGRIRDKLVSRYGDASVFMDIDSIPFGLDFREHVQAALRENDVLLAIIGPKWRGGGRGTHTRINDDNDPVRIEVETALQRGIPVIPVLVGGAIMPKPTMLPSGLQELSFRNAAQIDSGRDFHQQMERLIRSMDHMLEAKKGSAVSSRDMSPIPLPGNSVSDHIPMPVTRSPVVANRLDRILLKLGLLFSNQGAERDFHDLYRARFFGLGQTVMGFCIATWMVAGTVITLSGAGGLGLTRFHYMVGVPILLLVFGAGFTSIARRRWQFYFSLFSVVSLFLVFAAARLMENEDWFRPEQLALGYMLCIGLLGMLPLRVFHTFWIGTIIVAVNLSYDLVSDQVPTIIALIYCFGLVGSLIIACATAYFREIGLRETYEAKHAPERR